MRFLYSVSLPYFASNSYWLLTQTRRKAQIWINKFLFTIFFGLLLLYSVALAIFRLLFSVFCCSAFRRFEWQFYFLDCMKCFVILRVNGGPIPFMRKWEHCYKQWHRDKFTNFTIKARENWKPIHKKVALVLNEAGWAHIKKDGEKVISAASASFVHIFFIISFLFCVSI